MILLFTDFGSSDIYVGQVKAELARLAPQVPVVDLFNDAPAFHVRACAHLLAALERRLHPGDVVLAVVDPGVGTERRPVVVRADGKYFVGPDNGLLSVLAARAVDVSVWEIVWRADHTSVSFHGRDLFAPVAARIAAGAAMHGVLAARECLALTQAADIAEIIYIDHYGNGMSSLGAAKVPRTAIVQVNGRGVSHAAVFAAVPEGDALWYENSLGLLEIACNRASAAAALGFGIGDRVAISGERELP